MILPIKKFQQKLVNLLLTGCPFRHTDADLLRQRLAAYRVPKKGIDEVHQSILIHFVKIFDRYHWQTMHAESYVGAASFAHCVVQ